MPTRLHLRARIRRQHRRKGRRSQQLPDWRSGRGSVLYGLSGMLLLRERTGESLLQGCAVWEFCAGEHRGRRTGGICARAVGEHDAG